MSWWDNSLREYFEVMNQVDQIEVTILQVILNNINIFLKF